MNTTVTIHLAHILFHIDSDAYDLLKSYLNKLEKAFLRPKENKKFLKTLKHVLLNYFHNTQPEKDM